MAEVNLSVEDSETPQEGSFIAVLSKHAWPNALIFAHLSILALFIINMTNGVMLQYFPSFAGYNTASTLVELNSFIAQVGAIVSLPFAAAVGYLGLVRSAQVLTLPLSVVILVTTLWKTASMQVA